jgi:hypothetical protein
VSPIRDLGILALSLPTCHNSDIGYGRVFGHDLRRVWRSESVAMTDDPVSVLVDRAIHRHPNHVYDVNRICNHPRCQTVLSRYNGTSWCSVHERTAPKDGYKSSDFLAVR